MWFCQDVRTKKPVVQMLKGLKIMKKANRFIITASLIILLAFTSSLAAFLSFQAACMVYPYSQPCRFPAADLLIVISVLAVVLFWTSGHQAERLKRRLRRGMYGGSSVKGLVPKGAFSSVVKLVVEGDWSQQVEVTDRAGWWQQTPIENGTIVFVNRQDMYEWLVEVNVLSLELKPGQSPIARREWEPIVGKLQWDARCRLLLAVGAAVQNTSDARSRRLVRYDISRILEDLEQLGTFEA